MDSDYLNILQRGLDKLEIEYQSSQLEKTKIYLGLLKKWNQKYIHMVEVDITKRAEVNNGFVTGIKKFGKNENN